MDHVWEEISRVSQIQQVGDKRVTLRDNSHCEIKMPQESMSHLETVRRLRMEFIMNLTLRSFSFGREACMLTESRIMQRNSRHVEGPTVFSFESGTLNLQKTCTELWGEGKSTSRKSSSWCSTKESLQIFSKIQHSSSDNWKYADFFYSQKMVSLWNNVKSII